ncbi:MAG: hypothetical protein WCR32_04220, partial [Geobacter sp.]
PHCCSTTIATETTAADPQAAIPIGPGQPGIQRNALDTAAKTLAQLCGKCRIAFGCHGNEKGSGMAAAP